MEPSIVLGSSDSCGPNMGPSEAPSPAPAVFSDASAGAVCVLPDGKTVEDASRAKRLVSVFLFRSLLYNYDECSTRTTK